MTDCDGTEKWQNLFDHIEDRDRPYRRSNMAFDVSYLYRYFALNKRLIYVGITSHPGARHEQHITSEFCPYAAAMSVERFPHRHLAKLCESEAIASESPDFNAYPPMLGAFVPHDMRWFTKGKDRLSGDFRAWGLIGENWRDVHFKETAPRWWVEPFRQEKASHATDIRAARMVGKRINPYIPEETPQ